MIVGNHEGNLMYPCLDESCLVNEGEPLSLVSPCCSSVGGACSRPTLIATPRVMAVTINTVTSGKICRTISIAGLSINL